LRNATNGGGGGGDTVHARAHAHAVVNPAETTPGAERSDAGKGDWNLNNGRGADNRIRRQAVSTFVQRLPTTIDRPVDSPPLANVSDTYVCAILTVSLGQIIRQKRGN